jgi:hypothetical protein
MTRLLSWMAFGGLGLLVASLVGCAPPGTPSAASILAKIRMVRSFQFHYSDTQADYQGDLALRPVTAYMLDGVYPVLDVNGTRYWSDWSGRWSTAPVSSPTSAFTSAMMTEDDRFTPPMVMPWLTFHNLQVVGRGSHRGVEAWHLQQNRENLWVGMNGAPVEATDGDCVDAEKGSCLSWASIVYTKANQVSVVAPTPAQRRGPQVIRHGAVGQAVALNGAEVTVQKVTVAPCADLHACPPDTSALLLAMDVEIVDTTTVALPYGVSGCSAASDGQPTAVPNNIGLSAGGKVKPGQTVRGEVTYYIGDTVPPSTQWLVTVAVSGWDEGYTDFPATPATTLTYCPL